MKIVYTPHMHAEWKRHISKWTNYGEYPENAGEIGALLEEIERLTASRDAWKKVAEELGKNWKNTDSDSGIDYCNHCHCATFFSSKETITHSPDCPIEQLRKMKGREG